MSVAPIDPGASDHDACVGGANDGTDCWRPGDDMLHEDAPGSPAEQSARSAAPRARRTWSEPQLAKWIDAVVDHDERALAALYDATFSHVFAMAQSIARNTAMAEEVVEDTYFQVWRQAARFDPARGNALTWLLSIARSRALDSIRREARFRHARLDDDMELEVSSDTRAGDDLLDLARHHADLHRALMQIGAQPRQLVSLAFFRGLTHEEIAQQTQLPLGTVKSSLRRALLALRQILGDAGLAGVAS